MQVSQQVNRRTSVCPVDAATPGTFHRLSGLGTT